MRNIIFDLSIIWWSSCLEGSSSSRISAWRNASTACNSSASISSSKLTDITRLFLRPLFVNEFLNLVEALIAFFLSDPSLVFLSSSECSSTPTHINQNNFPCQHNFDKIPKMLSINNIQSKTTNEIYTFPSRNKNTRNSKEIWSWQTKEKKKKSRSKSNVPHFQDYFVTGNYIN